jgi:putative phosphoesterase
LTTRIGIVSDTHCPEFLDRLPDRLREALRGVDLILHAGDVNAPETIAELARIAPVQAIRGDHDRSLATLPLSREITVEGRRIVLVHGNRSRWLEEPHTLLWTLTLGYFQPHRGLPRALCRRFPGADVIVFGHTHRPHIETRSGTLLFNPGAVHQWNPITVAERLHRHPGWFEWCWLQVARHLRTHTVPSVGILEISDSEILPTVVEL